MNTALPPDIGITPATEPPGAASAASERPLLSLVIPVRNAAGTLPGTLSAIRGWVIDSTMSVEVIVVDDGSSDGTRAAASAFERRLGNLRILRHVDCRGRLEAVRTGERAATGTLIAFGREDELAASLEACSDLIVPILEGADVAVLPRAREHVRTPLPPLVRRRLSDSCRDWIRRAIARESRDPALLLCRATALRRMMGTARPIDFGADPDWLMLARRARCSLNVVRRGSASTPKRPRPAPTA